MGRLETRRRLALCLRWLPALAVMALIFSFSAQSGESSGELSGGLIWQLLKGISPGAPEAELAFRVNALQFWVRKGAHFLIYALLGLLLLWALEGYRLRPGVRLLWAAGLGLGYMVLDELHQSFVPGRTAKVTDVLIDFAGALAGMGLLCLLRRLSRKNPGKAGA